MAHISTLNPIMLSAKYDLYRLLQPSGMIYASDDKQYRYAFFGRDSIEVAEDLLTHKGNYIETLIVRLAELQGVGYNEITEEEPGKIHHEYRADVMEGKTIPSFSKAILTSLSAIWGGTDKELLYYGAADTTALYVRLVARHNNLYKTDLLSREYTARDGMRYTIAHSVEKALKWLEKKIEDQGFVTFCRTNPKGIICQVWKDSATSLVHVDGSHPNFKRPIATIELQAQAYDGLKLGSALLETYGITDKKQVKKWNKLADELQERTLSILWLPQVQRFATGLDKTEDGKWRIISSNTSNQGALLDSTILDTIDDITKQMYVQAIVKNLYSVAFLTPVGIRSQSLIEFPNINFQDYHGAWTVWVKETYDVAKGFRRYGFNLLADQLELRILNAIARAGSNREFFYVIPTGQVLYQPFRQYIWRGLALAKNTIEGATLPESGQAWSASAVYAIIATKSTKNDQIPTAYTELEQTLYRFLPQVDQKTLMLSNRLIGFIASQGYAIDVVAGKYRDSNWRRSATKDDQ